MPAQPGNDQVEVPRCTCAGSRRPSSSCSGDTAASFGRREAPASSGGPKRESWAGAGRGMGGFCHGRGLGLAFANLSLMDESLRDSISERVVPIVATKPKVQGLYLFGSLARGDHHKASDVDLASCSSTPTGRAWTR